MERQWVARPYEYADGHTWNKNRYELYIRRDGQWYSVGGAFVARSGRAIAFLCDRPTQRMIRTIKDVGHGPNSLSLWGRSLLEALKFLKVCYPDPEIVLEEAGWESTPAA